jgi:hypothetical protein
MKPLSFFATCRILPGKTDNNRRVINGDVEKRVPSQRNVVVWGWWLGAGVGCGKLRANIHPMRPVEVHCERQRTQ